MPRTEIDSLSSDRAQLVASLLARIDGLMAQIAARDDCIDKLLAQVKALNARIAELEAKRGGPPKTPDNSSLPPSRGQKASGHRWVVKHSAEELAEVTADFFPDIARDILVSSLRRYQQAGIWARTPDVSRQGFARLGESLLS